MIFSTFARALRSLYLILVVAIIVSSGGVVAFASQATPEIDLAGEGASITFGPVADAYVVQNAPDRNYGTRAGMISDEDPMTVAYVQFEIQGLDRLVEGATFRVWVTNPTQSAPSLWITPAVPLDEQGVTWNTRPALDALVDDGDGRTAPQGRWLEYDVSSVVTGHGLFSFALVPTSTDGIDFVSREGDEMQPELILELGDSTAVLLAAGDIANCEAGAETTAQILDQEAGTIITLGDSSQNEGTAEQFEECYDPTWGRHKDRTIPVPGNHDYQTDEAGPYYDYFGEAAGEPGKGYHSFTLGDWTLIGINTNIDIGPDSDQFEWVRTELEQNTAQCTLVYGHHSRFSSGMHGPHEFMDPLFTLFYDHGVELYLSGHDHHYERFRPQNPDGERDDEQGVRQFIVGTGGVQLRPFNEIQDHSEVRNSDVHGILRFTLHEDRYEFEFLAVEGHSFYDSGEDECHDAPDEPWSAEEEARFPEDYLVTDSRRLVSLPATSHRLFV